MATASVTAQTHCLSLLTEARTAVKSYNVIRISQIISEFTHLKSNDSIEANSQILDQMKRLEEIVRPLLNLASFSLKYELPIAHRTISAKITTLQTLNAATATVEHVNFPSISVTVRALIVSYVFPNGLLLELHEQLAVFEETAAQQVLRAEEAPFIEEIDVSEVRKIVCELENSSTQFEKLSAHPELQQSAERDRISQIRATFSKGLEISRAKIAKKASEDEKGVQNRQEAARRLGWDGSNTNEESSVGERERLTTLLDESCQGID